jgi:gas vesicle protein
MYRSETRILSIAAALALGALVGAGAALLMAPQSGQETRDMLRSKSMEIKDNAAKRVDDTRSRAGQAIEQLSQNTRERASSIRDRGEKMLRRSKLDEITNC